MTRLGFRICSKVAALGWRFDSELSEQEKRVMDRSHRGPRGLIAFAIMLAVVVSLGWGGSVEANRGNGQNLCIAHHGVVRVQMGTATCSADATSHVIVRGADSFGGAVDHSTVRVTGDENSASSSNSSSVTIDGDGNQVVAFEGTVLVDGDANTVLDSTISTVTIAGNENFVQVTNSMVVIDGYSNCVSGDVLNLVIVDNNTIVGTCHIP